MPPLNRISATTMSASRARYTEPMHGRVAIVCAAIGATTLPACDQLFDLRPVRDPATRDDAAPHPDGPSDSRAADTAHASGDAIAPCFDSPAPVPDISDGLDPQMSADRLEVIYAKSTTGIYDLYHATRSSTADTFTESLLTELYSSLEETDPALTADGLLIIFKSNRNGNGQRAFQATRTATDLAFGNVQLAPGVENIAISGLDISPDGNTIYIDDGSHLYVAHRPANSAAFGPPIQVSSGHIDYPSVTPNGLEVFSNGTGVVRATRATNANTDQFKGADSIFMNGNDADVLPDNSALILVSGSAFYTLERCN